MDVGLASALRQRDTPLWSRRPPFLLAYRPPSDLDCLDELRTHDGVHVRHRARTHGADRRAVGVPRTPSHPNANAAATVMVSSPIVPSRVPLSIPVAMALLVPVSLSLSRSPPLSLPPGCSLDALVRGPSFAVVAASSFYKKTASREHSAVVLMGYGI